MRPKDVAVARDLETRLQAFHQNQRPLPGIQTALNRNAFLEQLLESIHRVEYIAAIRRRPISPDRGNPNSELFDPLKGALLHYRAGDVDEAFWLVFLSVHFGKHLRDGWRLTRDIYGALGGPVPWTWTRTSADPNGFRSWLAANEATLTAGGISRRFGNHRRYETLKVSSNRGTAAVVESYVRWVGANRGHQLLIQDAQQEVGSNPRAVFEYLYRSMSEVTSFGRLGKFDYLTMIGKLGFAQIEPGSPYLGGATGPLTGASLLFTGSPILSVSAALLDGWVVQVGDHLRVNMQVMEDSLCNWQKSPAEFLPFRG